MAMHWLEPWLTRESTIPRKETSTSCLTKESKEPRDLVTITFSGTTTTSMRMTWSCLHTTSVTCTVDAQGDFKINFLTFKLTLFIWRSVSYPTPTYYAHLVADRARKHHNELAGYECGGSISGNSAGSVKLTETEKRKIQEILEKGVQKPMYFV